MSGDTIYSPFKDGIERNSKNIEYIEAQPPPDLKDVIACFWSIRSKNKLDSDFELHAIPDACVDIMFNELELEIAGLTTLRNKYIVLNLGREFHYVGAQLLPGVWRGNPEQIASQFIGTPYKEDLPLIETNRLMSRMTFEHKQIEMGKLVRNLMKQNLVVPNPVLLRILHAIDRLNSVAQMAEVACLSQRQLQRNIRRLTGFSPHDFLKIIRLQQAFKHGYHLYYADQSHFIHSFKEITGYTPDRFYRKFDV